MNDHKKILQKKKFLRRPTNFWGSGTWKQTIFLVWPKRNDEVLRNKRLGETFAAGKQGDMWKELKKSNN